MEYAAAMEDKASTQANSITELEASVDGQTILTKATYFVTSAVTTGKANKNLKELQAMTKQLTDSVTAKATTLADLITKKNSGNGRGGKITENNKARPGLHVCAHCKREVYHKYGN